MQSLWSYRPVLYSTATNDNFLNSLIDEEAIAGGIADNRVNPYVNTVNIFNNTYSTTLSANGYLEYKITNDLKLRATAGINLINGSNEVFNNSNTTAGSPLLSYGKTYGINAFVSNSNSYSFLNENTLNYNKQINKDNVLNAVAGFTTQLMTNSNSSMRVTNLPNEALSIKGIGQGTPFQVGSNSSLNSIQSFLGRVNYTFRQNYLLTASFRADGSSKFHPDNRWGYFPSGAFAWRFGNENFMKKLKFIDDAKLRISYGATGNNRVSDFAYLSVLNTGSTNYYSFNDQNLNGTVVSSMANKNLKWETTVQSDIGLDLSFFKNRFSLEVDYYKKKTSNLLLNASQAYSTGFTNAFQNVGSLSNEGLEFTVGTTNIKSKSFTWTTSFNISFNRNRILSLIDNQEALLTTRSFDATMTTPNYIAKVGRPVAQFYGYIADGMYQLDDFYKIPNGTTGYYYVLKENIPYYATKNTLSSPSTNTGIVVQPGDPKFKDLNGDGVIDILNDFTTIGNPYPLHFGGVSNNFNYKGFDLNVFFQWSYGNEIMNANRLKFEGGNGAPQSGSNITGANAGYINQNMYAVYANRWTPTNPSNEYYKVSAQTGGTRQYSTRIIEDGSYLRLKTVSLGYSLPVKLSKRIKIDNARFYVSAQNLLTFTKYTGPDPEVSTFTGNNLTPGFDFSPYPRTRVVTIGTNISF